MKALISKFKFWIGLGVVLVALFALFRVAPMQFITTDSMMPTIPAGSVVLDIPTTSVERGDVITFRDETGAKVTHRVIAIDSQTGSISTQGDANNAPDYHATPLTTKEVVGVVLGGRGVPWWSLLLIIIAIGLGYYTISLIRSSRSVNEDNKIEEETPEPTPV